MVKKLVIIFILVLLPFVASAEGKYFTGASVYYGWGLDQREWRSTDSGINVYFGYKPYNRTSLSLETKFSHLSFKQRGSDKKEDATEIGLAIMLRYDLLYYERLTLFGEFGGGAAYITDTPNKNILGNNPLGLINVGLGFNIDLPKNWDIDVATRYTHSSSHNPGDTGVNFMGIWFGVTRRF